MGRGLDRRGTMEDNKTLRSGCQGGEEVPAVSKESRKLIAKNSKAFHDYFVEDRYEAGIELAGTEVKSIRMGNVNLKDSFCTIKDGQMTSTACT